MSAPTYTPSHPRWHQPRLSTWWWLTKRSYLVFILRELSSLFVAWFVAFVLLLVRAVDQGPAAYDAFLDWAANPWVVVLNVIALAFLILHAMTWFALTPQAMVVRFRGRKVPPVIVEASQYAAWAAVSVFLLWLLAGG